MPMSLLLRGESAGVLAGDDDMGGDALGLATISSSRRRVRMRCDSGRPSSEQHTVHTLGVGAGAGMLLGSLRSSAPPTAVSTAGAAALTALL